MYSEVIDNTVNLYAKEDAKFFVYINALWNELYGLLWFLY